MADTEDQHADPGTRTLRFIRTASRHRFLHEQTERVNNLAFQAGREVISLKTHINDFMVVQMGESCDRYHA